MSAVQLNLTEIPPPRRWRWFWRLFLLAGVVLGGFWLMEAIRDVRHAAWRSQDL